MEAVKSIEEFKHFLQMNRKQIYAGAENANDILADDEWMQENQWDEIYKQGENCQRMNICKYMMRDGNVGCSHITEQKTQIRRI